MSIILTYIVIYNVNIYYYQYRLDEKKCSINIQESRLLGKENYQRQKGTLHNNTSNRINSPARHIIPNVYISNRALKHVRKN